MDFEVDNIQRFPRHLLALQASISFFNRLLAPGHDSMCRFDIGTV